jgi:DNA invertase Pin-like site-specific DNA recombinase
MADGKFIAYYRVSTARQGASGLGLEAQRKAVADHLDGSDWQLLGEYTEVETGKGSNALARRPQLREAIQQARREKAVLVIAKLDRLARNVAFISELMEGGVEFVAVDLPFANKFMLHVMAAVAEFERDQISARTKDALAAAKARGVKLGKHGKVLAQKNSQEAKRFARDVSADVSAVQADGFTSVRAITDELNRREVATPRGERWHIASVHRLLRRLDTLNVKEAA